jgi:hypothetical protein
MHVRCWEIWNEERLRVVPGHAGASDEWPALSAQSLPTTNVVPSRKR